MAGRTSEKGNTTGKTIFCFIGKVIGAGITAFAILALFAYFITTLRYMNHVEME